MTKKKIIKFETKKEGKVNIGINFVFFLSVVTLMALDNIFTLPSFLVSNFNIFFLVI